MYHQMNTYRNFQNEPFPSILYDLFFTFLIIEVAVNIIFFGKGVVVNSRLPSEQVKGFEPATLW